MIMFPCDFTTIIMIAIVYHCLAYMHVSYHIHSDEQCHRRSNTYTLHMHVQVLSKRC